MLIKKKRFPKGPRLADVHDVAVQSAPSLCELENVMFVTVGQKRVNGLRTRDPAIIVYVSEKKPVSSSQEIPRTIVQPQLRTRINTDVVQLKTPLTTFGARAGNVLLASDRNYGVCTLCFSKGGTSYLMTNAHIAYDIPAGGAPCELSLVESTTNQLVDVGPAVWSTGLEPGAVALNDAAAVRATLGNVEPYMITGVDQPVSGTSHFVPGNTTYWFMWNGVEFNCAFPEPATHPTVVDVEGVGIQYNNFWTLHMTKGASSPGQSGALICRTDVDRIIGCGILFGGSAPDIILAFSLDQSFNEVYQHL